MNAAELSIPTPVGDVTVISDGAAITGLAWRTAPSPQETPELLEACAQLKAYFEGELTTFDLPLRVRGSNAQKEVCAQMAAIPFGETLTYGDIAASVGLPAQAVGAACGGNPIPVIIPCHRVLGATSLGGFSGGVGIDTKVWLLRHEGAAGLLI
ncbi:MAG: methylated-DNA--[protein]-cysteine S-methyltransferase [Pseudomonadota bacterium]